MRFPSDNQKPGGQRPTPESLGTCLEEQGKGRAVTQAKLDSVSRAEVEARERQLRVKRRVLITQRKRHRIPSSGVGGGSRLELV